MMVLMLSKRLITSRLPLLTAMPVLSPIPFAFTVKPHKSANFCTQIVSPSTAPHSSVVTEFFINKCGLTQEEITKYFKRHSRVLSAKSTQSLEEVLELLKGCSLTTSDQFRRVVRCNPMLFLSRSSEITLKSKLAFLRTFMEEEDISKLIITHARAFKSSEKKFKSAISLLKRLGVEDRVLSELVAKQPLMLAASEEKVTKSFRLAEDLGLKLGSKKFAVALQGMLERAKETLEQRLEYLSSLGFSKKEISQMINRQPSILWLSNENLKRHVDFLIKTAGITLSDLVKYPNLLQLSLEKRVIPRHRVMEALKSMQALKTKMHFISILYLTDKRFLEIYVDSNAESSVLRDIYHNVKGGVLNTDEETYSESDVGPSISTMRQGRKAGKCSVEKETLTESHVGIRLGHGESHPE